MSTSTALAQKTDQVNHVAEMIENRLIVKISNNVVDVKKCIQIAYDADFGFRGVIKFRGDFYLAFDGENVDVFKDYHTMRVKDMDIDNSGRIKRAIHIGDTNFSGFCMADDTLHEYITSIYGVSDDDSSSECPCCRAFTWKVKVPNNRNKIKKLLRTALCHYGNKCVPVGIYHQNKDFYIQFNSIGRDPIACVAREGFTEYEFASHENDGDRVTRQRPYGFAMQFIEFWDYVEELLDTYKKRYEKEGKDICE